ncbi:AMP-binding protein [Sneathiella sp.]|uniref:AMP-binding protein n=1 Tax=Sneathiella sp. TaxID=1964365 RepID=UPI0039E25A7E
MTHSIPFRKLDRPLPDISVIKSTDGSYRIKSNIAIGDYKKNAAAFWVQAAEEFPDRDFLVKCSEAEDWPRLTYGEAKIKADQISSWLIENGYDTTTPIMILSGNSFAHALLSMGALQIGVPIIPVSPSFSLMTGDYSKLRYAVELTEPKMVFAEHGSVFKGAIDAIRTDGLDIVTVEDVPDGAVDFEALFIAVNEEAVQKAFSRVNEQTLAKILFTSGSTGMPKAVPNTHLMICSSQKMHELISEPKDPVNNPTIVLDWLPWHHTYGGNVNFFGIMRQVGTMYLDDGKPIPGLFQRTIENLKRVKPTRFSSVPTAFSFLLDAMEQDEDFAKTFLEQVRICSYGGAALSQELFERMQVLSVRHIGMRMPFGTGWGSTETTGTGTAVFWETDKVGLIGVPYSGVEIKLVPVSDKFEIRIKGPHVHTEYYKRPDLTDQYFDEEGFYIIGDAVKFEDPENLEQGLVFSGRVSEDFKLANGTWVETGSLRLSLIDALDPLARDIVLAGHDKEYLSILVVPSEGVMARAQSLGHPTDESAPLILNDDLIEEIAQKVRVYNSKNSAKSRFVGAVAVLGTPLSVDRNEITDKQYINQSAVLENRSQIVKQLYQDTPTPGVLSFK